MAALADIRLADLLTLLAVHRTGSISGAARELKVTPSQVSKAVSRLERLYRARLLRRGPRGVMVTPAAQRMLPHIASAVESLRATNGVNDERRPDVELGIAGPAYVMRDLVPTLANALPRVRIRALEMAPALIRASVAENVFDIAVVPGGVRTHLLGWSSEAVGSLRSGLFARPAFVDRLGPVPLLPEQVRPLPFVGPTRADRNLFFSSIDDCPLPPQERQIAHEVQTIDCALEFVSRTDFVVFGPVFAARPYVEAGVLREIPVVGWNVSETVHVVCNADRVLARLRAATTDAMRALLGERRD
jgi:DNA-binding transcriptional LysR family regulator